MTATSSQGLALMNEMLHIASGLRLPIVMPEVNRALSAPINIHGDHSDTMASKDTGWLQINCENGQEAYDSIIQAIRICEHPDVMLPAIVSDDGFIISHCMEAIDILSDEEVKNFIGEYKPKRYLLDVAHPYTLGALDLQDYYFEHKRQEIEAMNNAGKVILEVAKEFGQKFGRHYGLFEEYKMDGAEVAILVMGSTAGTTKQIVNELRVKGIKAGLLRLRIFRPFPFSELAKALSNVKVLAVLDRSDAFNGFGGPLFEDVRAALYDLEKRPKMINYVFGLGGRDIGLEDIKGVYANLQNIAETGDIKQVVSYLGVRE
jgi:pyruvate ferredoxin oxidoreductase alpha subunit